ncbi:hypothetical protein Q3G72_028441 [Acer saccharum]|nr:hypothetical protein Q3G72_028441 [Acer saccharum]
MQGNCEMQHDNVLPDPCTYNILIDGLCKNGCVLEAVDLFHNLKNCKFDLSIEIASCLINGPCKTKKLEIAWKFYQGLPHFGLLSNVLTYNIMINGFCREGHLEKANDLLLEMEEKGYARNVITYNLLMCDLFQNDEPRTVVELFHKMAERNLKPDTSTTSIVVDLLIKDEKYCENLDLLPSFSVQDEREKVDMMNPDKSSNNTYLVGRSQFLTSKKAELVGLLGATILLDGEVYMWLPTIA